MRLTTKRADKYDFDEYDQFNEVCNKLGQLEDIEDELGIDLITLFKALKNGIYRFNENKEVIFERIEHYVPYMKEQLHTRGRLSIIHGVISEEKEKHFAIKDYGKTWALTKDELKGN